MRKIHIAIVAFQVSSELWKQPWSAFQAAPDSVEVNLQKTVEAVSVYLTVYKGIQDHSHFGIVAAQTLSSLTL